MKVRLLSSQFTRCFTVAGPTTRTRYTLPMFSKPQCNFFAESLIWLFSNKFNNVTGKLWSLPYLVWVAAVHKFYKTYEPPLNSRRPRGVIKQVPRWEPTIWSLSLGVIWRFVFDACEVTHTLGCLGRKNCNILLKISGVTVQILAAGDLCNPSVTHVCMYLSLNVVLTQGCLELEVGPLLTNADATWCRSKVQSESRTRDA